MSVSLQVADGVATVTLDRPENFNAIDIDLAESLEARVGEAAASDAEVVVLRGSGRGFCGGGDVRAMAASPDPAAYLDELVETAHRAMIALRGLPQPIVARVHGAAAGAGIGILLAADVVIASERASFTPAYGAIGLSPDCGGTALIAEAIGTVRARSFFLLGEKIDAATAGEWGLVTRVVSDDTLDREVDEAVSAIRAQGPHAPRATKYLLGLDGSYADRLAEERRLIVENARTDVARERIARFGAGE